MANRYVIERLCATGWESWDYPRVSKQEQAIQCLNAVRAKTKNRGRKFRLVVETRTPVIEPIAASTEEKP